MIDIHCHILEGLDDGARTMEDSIAMAEAAVSQGIYTIVATPHHRNNQFDNYKGGIITQVNLLNEVLQERNIPLNILPGQEVRIYGELIEGIEAGEILTVNADSPYVLVELPTSTVPRFTKQLLYDLQLEGYTPVIVHPERNKTLLEKPDMLYEFVKNGALTQVTAASIIGKFGKKIRTFSHDLVQANLTHFIASDAHNTTSRGFVMQDAHAEVKKAYGNSMVYWFMENAQLMIDGKTVVGDVPEKISRKKFLGLF